MSAVEVAYVAADGSALLLAVELGPGSTVADAIASSGLLTRVPGLAATDENVGIFSKRCTLATVLRDGDRVEVYRPLVADPKDTRRLRAALQEKKR